MVASLAMERQCFLPFCVVSLLLLPGAFGECVLRHGPRGCRSESSGATLVELEVEDAESEVDCFHAAQLRWVNCQNAALEPVFYSWVEKEKAATQPSTDDPDLKSYPPQNVTQSLTRMEENPINLLFQYDISFHWATNELTQYSDVDLNNPACGEEWNSLRYASWDFATMPQPEFCTTCREEVSAMWGFVDSIDGAWFPISGARTDCALGILTIAALDFACICCGFSDLVSAGFLDQLLGLWRRLQLELEAFLFFLEAPLTMLPLSLWPVPALLRRIGASLRMAFEAVLPNECDLLDLPSAVAFQARLLAMLQQWSVHGEDSLRSSEDVSELLGDAKGYVDRHFHGCPFGQSTAILVMVQVGMINQNLVLSDRNLDWMALDSLKAWDALAADRVGRQRRFFYDLLTTDWPWLQILQAMGDITIRQAESEEGQRLSRMLASPFQSSSLVSSPVSKSTRSSSCVERVLRNHESWTWQRYSSPFNGAGEVPTPLGITDRSLEDFATSLCQLEGIEVMFISGTSSGYKWGSFTVRGRQAARGLRQSRARGPAIRARAFNNDCEVWCTEYRRNHEHEEGVSQEEELNWSNPRIVIHIKYPCKCAMELLPTGQTLHLYDPVDQFALVPDNIDAVLAQTSTAAIDYGNHPSSRTRGVRSFWHPLHHSNFKNLRAPARDTVEVMGVHTTHNDTELYSAIKRMLEENADLEVRFEHADPAARFYHTAGNVITPLQTNQVMEQLADLEVTVLRSAGCMQHLNCNVTRKWFCDRYKTGQRLVNAFSVGLPAVVFAEQGFLDVVHGSDYPVVSTIEEALSLLKEVLTDASLRARLMHLGIHLAEPYSLERMSDRLVLILAHLFREIRN